MPVQSQVKVFSGDSVNILPTHVPTADAGRLYSPALSHRVRELAFRLCAGDGMMDTSELFEQTARAWTDLLRWLDASGLALYFADRLMHADQIQNLPAPVAMRLRESLLQNKQRTLGMIRESASIQCSFERVGLSYAVMKGMSLVPISVPRLELRHQFDLDYLVAESQAEIAHDVLEAQGYRLFEKSGKTWEYKKGETPRVSARDLYKDLPYRGVELHLESESEGRNSRLARVATREVCGIKTPVLDGTDILLGQARHIFKDLKGAFVRGSHLLEFHRHIVSLRDEDRAYWEALHARLEENSYDSLCLGVALQLLREILDSPASDALAEVAAASLPPEVRLWLRMYGARSFLGNPPGTKLGLLLDRLVRESMPSGAPWARKTWSLPRLPPVVVRAIPGESIATRSGRYWIQGRYIASRLCFHTVETGRLALEKRRWRRMVNTNG